MADDHRNQDGPITVARAFERQQLRNRLRVAHIRDNALIKGRAADPVDVDHVPPGLKPVDRFLCCFGRREACRRGDHPHTPAATAASAHFVRITAPAEDAA